MEGRKHRNILGYVKKLDLNQLNKLVFLVGVFLGTKDDEPNNKNQFV